MAEGQNRGTIIEGKKILPAIKNISYLFVTDRIRRTIIDIKKHILPAIKNISHLSVTEGQNGGAYYRLQGKMPDLEASRCFFF